MVATLKKMINDDGQPFFDVWTQQLNDEIQTLAISYGERFMLESALHALHYDCVHKGAHNILEKCLKLYMITLID